MPGFYLETKQTLRLQQLRQEARYRLARRVRSFALVLVFGAAFGASHGARALESNPSYRRSSGWVFLGVVATSGTLGAVAVGVLLRAEYLPHSVAKHWAWEPFVWAFFPFVLYIIALFWMRQPWRLLPEHAAIPGGGLAFLHTWYRRGLHAFWHQSMRDMCIEDEPPMPDPFWRPPKEYRLK